MAGRGRPQLAPRHVSLAQLAAISADEYGMKRTMSTKKALVGLAASLAGFAVASVAYFGQRR